MRYFKGLNGDVFAFEVDGSQDELITPDMVEMTPEEVDAHKNPPPVPPTPAEELAASDAGMVRMIEDLTQTLINKGVIIEADLPVVAQEKLNKRKALRAKL